MSERIEGVGLPADQTAGDVNADPQKEQGSPPEGKLSERANERVQQVVNEKNAAKKEAEEERGRRTAAEFKISSLERQIEEIQARLQSAANAPGNKEEAEQYDKDQIAYIRRMIQEEQRPLIDLALRHEEQNEFATLQAEYGADLMQKHHNAARNYKTEAEKSGRYLSLSECFRSIVPIEDLAAVVQQRKEREEARLREASVLNGGTGGKKEGPVELTADQKEIAERMGWNDQFLKEMGQANAR